MSKKTSIIFVTGGVVSSLGKGVLSSSLAALIKACGLNVTCIKIDPYINCDPGTMSPYEHGEVFVTRDGSETDLDLGNYERFNIQEMTKTNSITTGQIYTEVINKERRGDYLGQTVQVIPHITDHIKATIARGIKDHDVAVVEVGGTIGDIESLPYIEALRQIRTELGSQQCIFAHLTLVPYLDAVGEFKTKPTQHSIKELRSLGIQPDIIFCRSENILDHASKSKIALFSSLPIDKVINLTTVESIYQVPRMLLDQGVAALLANQLKIVDLNPDLQCWDEVDRKRLQASKSVDIALVGKYVSLKDAYKSVFQAIDHAGIYTGCRVNVHPIDAEDIKDGDTSVFDDYHAVLIPGGFGQRGIEGMIWSATLCRMKKIPYFGICLGMQIAVIAHARHFCGLSQANSTEFDPQSQHPVIDMAAHWHDAQSQSMKQQGYDEQKGASMRLGAQPIDIEHGSLAHKIYQTTQISERHRHRYEVNKTYIETMSHHGINFSAYSQGTQLVEMIEVPQHPFYIACQFHPEFESRPHKPHPIFMAFITAAIKHTDHAQHVTVADGV